MLKLLFSLTWPLAFFLSFVANSTISAADGPAGALLRMPLAIVEELLPSQWSLVVIFAVVGTVFFALNELLILAKEMPLQPVRRRRRRRLR